MIKIFTDLLLNYFINSKKYLNNHIPLKVSFKSLDKKQFGTSGIVQLILFHDVSLFVILIHIYSMSKSSMRHFIVAKIKTKTL